MDVEETVVMRIVVILQLKVSIFTVRFVGRYFYSCLAADMLPPAY